MGEAIHQPTAQRSDGAKVQKREQNFETNGNHGIHCWRDNGCSHDQRENKEDARRGIMKALQNHRRRGRGGIFRRGSRRIFTPLDFFSDQANYADTNARGPMKQKAFEGRDQPDKQSEDCKNNVKLRTPRVCRFPKGKRVKEQVLKGFLLESGHANTPRFFLSRTAALLAEIERRWGGLVNICLKLKKVGPMPADGFPHANPQILRGGVGRGRKEFALV
jgi:hypothetical protein